MEFIQAFIDFIMGLVKQIQDMVAGIRAENDKKD